MLPRFLWYPVDWATDFLRDVANRCGDDALPTVYAVGDVAGFAAVPYGSTREVLVGDRLLNLPRSSAEAALAHEFAHLYYRHNSVSPASGRRWHRAAATAALAVAAGGGAAAAGAGLVMAGAAAMTATAVVVTAVGLRQRRSLAAVLRRQEEEADAFASRMTGPETVVALLRWVDTLPRGRWHGVRRTLGLHQHPDVASRIAAVHSGGVRPGRWALETGPDGKDQRVKTSVHRARPTVQTPVRLSSTAIVVPGRSHAAPSNRPMRPTR